MARIGPLVWSKVGPAIASLPVRAGLAYECRRSSDPGKRQPSWGCGRHFYRSRTRIACWYKLEAVWNQALKFIPGVQNHEYIIIYELCYCNNLVLFKYNGSYALSNNKISLCSSEYWVAAKATRVSQAGRSGSTHRLSVLMPSLLDLPLQSWSDWCLRI